MNISVQQVSEAVSWLSSIGGTAEGGTTRLLYSAEWLEAQNQLREKIEAAGMIGRFDNVGNLFGRLEGSKYPDQVIMSGSHVDTVVNGGKLDGQFGILAAYLACKYLIETYGTPLRTLEIVSLAEEEGSRFPYVFWGSKNILGLAKKQDVIDISDAKGVKFVDAMTQCGFKFRDESQPVRNDIKAFVELHIEQGSVLEKEGQQIGVVTSIVGQRRYTVKLAGEANHAGTTPMGYRKDTVYAFSRICSQTVEKAVKRGDPLVVTFGRVEPSPNTVNVVPGATLFTMDCRHTDREQLVEFSSEIEADMRRIAAEMGIAIEIDLWMDEAPVPMDSGLVNLLKTICEEEKLNFRVMHSGAGHDSQIFAPTFPTAMLFVPSIKGISHNPAENTLAEDLTEGVKALTHALYKLAYQE
jgi:allantoate deiminase